MAGNLVNFLALGNHIKHPPSNQSANVIFVDMCFEPKYLPGSFRRYLPNICYDFTENIDLMGVFTLVDIVDNTELFVDFWDLFVFEKDKVPDWLCIPPDNLGKFFVKRQYENQLSIATEMAKQMFVPEAVINKMDLDLIIKSEVRELLSPQMKEHIKLIQESEKSNLIK